MTGATAVSTSNRQTYIIKKATGLSTGVKVPRMRLSVVDWWEIGGIVAAALDQMAQMM